MEGERALKTAVKNARSSFYENKGKLLSRKQTRKKKGLVRVELHKKNKKNATVVEDGKEERLQINRKRRKRKRKLVCEPDERDSGLSSEHATYIAASNADDKIIASLGKKLRVSKTGRMPKTFQDDGLDYLLDVCQPLQDDSDHNSSDDEYLAMKSTAKKQTAKTKRKQQIKDKSDVWEGDARGYKRAFASSEDHHLSEDDENVEDRPSHQHQANFSISESSSERLSGDQINEDLADETSEDEANDDDNLDQADKYVPPAKRKLQEAISNSGGIVKAERLKKQLKGLINRLSSSTLPSLLSEIEGMYCRNSRNLMNEALYQQIFSACCPGMRLPDRLLFEHMMLVAALHLQVGAEVGSYFLEKIIENFHNLHQSGDTRNCEEGKEIDNLVIMIVALYHFKVVESLLLYDILRRLIDNFKEKDIDLILSILKTCGPEIRKDDPATLKEIILETQAKSISAVGVKDNSRMRFMLDAITALKNNNMRKIPNYDPTVIEEAKKNFRSLVRGKSSTSSGVQLKVSLDDLINAKEKGRWWIVGSAWSGHGPNIAASQNEAASLIEKNVNANNESDNESQMNSHLIKVAKQQRMNTELRRIIFCTIMTSEDYIDAFEKLLKLNLKEKQARDIVHVLVDCCLQEKQYNPFYEHLSDKLCTFNRSNQVTFQYTFWDRFKTFSTLASHSRENLARLLAHLFASKSLSISVLKVVTFGSMDEVSVKFFTCLFSIILLQYPKNIIKSMFKRIASFPKLSLLREGIKIFLRRFLVQTDPNENEIHGPPSTVARMDELVHIVELALDGQEYTPL